jgi:phospholipase C
MLHHHSGMGAWSRRLALCASAATFLVASSAFGRGDPDAAADRLRTATPIKHVIVLIGENWSFDSLYATFEPRRGQTVQNLLSRGIINEDGTPGVNFAETQQFKVNTPLPAHYFISSDDKTAYAPFLPTPELNGAPNKQSSLTDIQAGRGRPPFDNTVSQAMLAANEPSLEAEDLNLLRSGATGAPGITGPDRRVANFATLPNGVYQITNPATLPYDSYTGDTVHRLFHMWQQVDCSVANATPANPSGCLGDLYPFVATARDDSGSNSMGFFNMDRGDVPLLNRLAHEFALSDNFHQAVMGGTAANHMMLGTGDAIFWTPFNGIDTPPAKVIADPDPKSPASDAFTVDGNFTACGDTTQPGIAPIVGYLGSLPWHPHSNCAAGDFYMINNVAPGFLPNGQIDTAHITAGAAVPPSALRTIGDALNDKHIDWAYYGGGYDAAVRVANGTPRDAFDRLVAQNYCDICNFESYVTSIMGNPAQRAAHIKDAIDFFAAVQNDTLPPVSFVKPDSFLDGHPASSKPDLFEGMLDKIVDMLQSKPELFADTALFVVFDESGGFHDSAFLQPLDFFGDGPRIPFLVVSPWAAGGRVVHTYTDHVSILKFIERNWGLSPLTSRSRDNLQNPTPSGNPYVPGNMPAIGDLFDMFNFDFDHDGDVDVPTRF